MNVVIVAYFGLLSGAAGGILMAGSSLFRWAHPTWLATAHGLANLGSLFLLFLGLMSSDALFPARIWWGLGILTAALAGGLILFRVLFPKRAPLPLIGVHALLAGFGLFLLYPVIAIAR